MIWKAASLFAQVVRTEGPKAARDRVMDRLSEMRRRRSLDRLQMDARGFDLDFEPPPVINISPIPISPNRGGSQIQMIDRLHEERQRRSVALAYPGDRSWSLEMWRGDLGGAVQLGSADQPLAAVTEAAALVHTRSVHIENPYGLPPDLPTRLDERGLQTILSVHDFTPFCPRPHLIDVTVGTFCEYSEEREKCARCLSASVPLAELDIREYRATSGRAVASAGALVFPSSFLQRQFAHLFPERKRDQIEKVISPATYHARPGGSPARDTKRIAFVGGALHHKGGALIPEIVRRVRADRPGTVGYVYGTGDPALLGLIRSTDGTRVRGYYRQGHLSSLLTRDRIAAAVLPSIWPEAYGLVVDECVAVGIPVVTFDHGAVPERLESWRAGRCVELSTGARGLASATVDLLSNWSHESNFAAAKIPDPRSAARQHLALYSSLPG
jgi:glycosyltransferase involved in cell wall biosynthesis